MSLVICPSLFLLIEGGVVLVYRHIGVEIVAFENLAYIPGQILQSKGGRMKTYLSFHGQIRDFMNWSVLCGVDACRMGKP